MQYRQPFVMLTAMYINSLVRGSSAPGPMTSLMFAQTRRKAAGSCASTFQKLLIQSVLRVAIISSYTARTSGLASAYSIGARAALETGALMERSQSRARENPSHSQASGSLPRRLHPLQAPGPNSPAVRSDND